MEYVIGAAVVLAVVWWIGRQRRLAKEQHAIQQFVRKAEGLRQEMTLTQIKSATDEVNAVVPLAFTYVEAFAPAKARKVLRGILDGNASASDRLAALGRAEQQIPTDGYAPIFKLVRKLHSVDHQFRAKGLKFLEEPSEENDEDLSKTITEVFETCAKIRKAMTPYAKRVDEILEQRAAGASKRGNTRGDRKPRTDIQA